MSEPITLDQVRTFIRLAGTVRDSLSSSEKMGVHIADLAISQAETIRLQGEEIERLQKDFDLIVMSTRSKELTRLSAELSKVKQERDEAYERAAQVVMQIPISATPWTTDSSAESALMGAVFAIRALKTNPSPTTDEGTASGGNVSDKT